MDSNTFEYGDKGKDRISGFGIATLGEVVIDILDIHVDLDSKSLEFRAIHILRMFTRGNGLLFGFEQHFAETLYIFLAVSDRLIHIRHSFIAQFDGHAGDIGFGIFEFPVFELSFNDFLAFGCLFILDLFEGLADLILGFGRRHKGQPVGIRVLVW